MALTYGYFNSVGGDRKYNAEQMSKYFSGIISKGVLQNYANKFQVFANNELNIQVSTGKAYFTNGQWVENDSIINLTLDAASVSLPRIDRVVLRKDTDEESRNVSLLIKKGTPATSPSPPELINNEYVEELSLCQILIGANVTSISQSNITDERPNKTLCGFTHQLFDQVDTTEIFAQYDDAFNTWFQDLKSKVAEATLVRQFTSTYITETQDQTVIPINISQYQIDADILNIYINGLKLVQNVDYTKSQTSINLTIGVDIGTQIEFEVLKSVDGSSAETVVSQVEQLQNDVDEIEKYTYYCNGSNDNQLLTELCEDFIGSKGIFNDLNRLTINVSGSFGIDTNKVYTGEEGKTYSISIINANQNKELFVNFSHCDTIIPTGALLYAQGVTIYNLSVKHNNKTEDSDIYTISGYLSTFENCRITGQYNGGTCSAMNLISSKVLNCNIDITSSGIIYGFSGSDTVTDNCNVTVKSTASNAYATALASSRSNNCNFKGITDSTSTSSSGNGALGHGIYANCLFEGFGGYNGYGLYIENNKSVNISNCIFRGYTSNSSNGSGIGLITETEDGIITILHGINCNQVSSPNYSQTGAMNIAGGYGVYDGQFYTAPIIYNNTNVVSHGAFNQNIV